MRKYKKGVAVGLLFALVFITTIASAQTTYKTLPIIDGRIVFTEVVTIDSTPSTQILKNAKLFFAENINDSKQAIEFSDESTLIVNTSFSPVVSGSFGAKIKPGRIDFTIKIEAKENRYKYTYSDFQHNSENNKVADGGALEDDKADGGMNGLQNKIWKQYKEKTLEFVNIIIKDLHTSISKPTQDW